MYKYVSVLLIESYYRHTNGYSASPKLEYYYQTIIIEIFAVLCRFSLEMLNIFYDKRLPYT